MPKIQDKLLLYHIVSRRIDQDIIGPKRWCHRSAIKVEKTPSLAMQRPSNDDQDRPMSLRYCHIMTQTTHHHLFSVRIVFAKSKWRYCQCIIAGTEMDHDHTF